MKGGREDLIGFDKKCLIRPRKMGNQSKTQKPDGGKLQKEGAKGKIKNNSVKNTGKKKTIRNVHKKK